MDMFFTLVDDQDADVRMIADENLNKVIRNVSESQLGRLQVRLFHLLIQFIYFVTTVCGNGNGFVLLLLFIDVVEMQIYLL
jgi:hypothetical protein